MRVFAEMDIVTYCVDYKSKKPVLESICWYLPKPFKCVHFKLAISLLRLYPTVILAQDICTRVFIFIHIISEENWKPK